MKQFAIRNDLLTPAEISEYIATVKLVRSGGMASVQVREKNPTSPFLDPKHHKQFLTACHRGFEKAQNRIVEHLQDIKARTDLNPDEAWYLELLWRKLADCIAEQLFLGRSHIMRRMSMDQQIRKVELSNLVRDLGEANKRNAESRMTFALLCDLTTYVHIADLVRIDRRHDPIRLTLVELKTGAENLVLERELAKYVPEPSSLQKIDEDPAIREQLKAQAKRMLRQTIRRENVQTIMRTDRGTDTKFQTPLRLIGPEIKCPKYDGFLDELATNATKSGSSAGTVCHFLHFGVGHSTNPPEAAERAEVALNWAVYNAFQDQPQ
jgi:hypothetical protein